jgi:cytochrome P450
MSIGESSMGDRIEGVMTSAEPRPTLNSADSSSLAAVGLGYVRDPYPEFARLRQDSPVTRQDAAFVGGPPSYVVYSHDTVTEVLHDGDTYSSAIITQGMSEVWGPKIIVGMDEPEHRQHRALVSMAFRQRTLARWEESLVGRVVDELIEGFVDEAVPT